MISTIAVVLPALHNQVVEAVRSLYSTGMYVHTSTMIALSAHKL